jgi:hypothetical protein
MSCWSSADSAHVHAVLTRSDVLDVDGNGWSSRYHRLMLSGSAVVKSTIYPEWHSDWLTPWVHYIVGGLDV